MDYERIKRALPVESGPGGRSKLRMRPDVAEIIADCVLKRRKYIDIAKRSGVALESLQRFRASFITEEIKKIVLSEAQKDHADALDEETNAHQDDVQKGLVDILTEQKSLYRAIKAKVGEDRDVEDMLPALQSLLRDQGQSFERMAKAYANLKDKTTITLSLNESPDVAKLMDALYVVFEQHPDAFATFQGVVADKRIALDV